MCYFAVTCVVHRIMVGFVWTSPPHQQQKNSKTKTKKTKKTKKNISMSLSYVGQIAVLTKPADQQLSSSCVCHFCKLTNTTNRPTNVGQTPIQILATEILTNSWRSVRYCIENIKKTIYLPRRVFSVIKPIFVAVGASNGDPGRLLSWFPHVFIYKVRMWKV